MSKPAEIRHATLSVGGAEEEVLDEVVGSGPFHLEGLGWQSWFVAVGDLHCSMYVERLPFRWWWPEVRDAISDRRWPTLHRITLRVNERIPEWIAGDET